MSKILERAKALFERNTQANEVYATSDEYLFFDKTKAEGHAGTLSDRNLQIISRAQAEGNIDVTETETETDAQKAFTETLLQRTNAELKKLATEYGLETNGKENKKQLVELIVAHAEKQGKKSEPKTKTEPGKELTELEIAQRNAEEQSQISEDDKAKVATAQ